MFRRPSEATRPFDIRDFLDGQAAFYAGTANVILQLGWPAIGYGVYESKVDDGSVMKVPRKRARTTVTYLAVSLLGREDERAHLRNEVNRQHRQVRSTDSSPVKYNAFSRDLQLWVGACLAYGSRDFYEALHGPVPAHLAEPYYRHLGRLATTLQVPEDLWPESWAEFEDYWEWGIAQVTFDETLKGYLNGLLDLEQLGRFQQKRLAPFHRWVNTGFLPPAIRELMELEWSDEDEVRFRRLMARTGRRNRRVPRAVRNFPFNALLWDFRTRRALRRPIV
jgi:uncharacterized protein (DUF2236 family)